MELEDPMRCGYIEFVIAISERRAQSLHVVIGLQEFCLHCSANASDRERGIA